MTEGEGLAQSEGASGKLIDQRRGNVRRQVRGRVFLQASRLLKLSFSTGQLKTQSVMLQTSAAFLTDIFYTIMMLSKCALLNILIQAEPEISSHMIL